ncbi:MAG: helix-turn-helix transcriptional regulator [Gammaproteobacteria bacterium]|nr:helix-turn-helix transcriptional regulator [Gammaproteobacteria bacterium]
MNITKDTETRHRASKALETLRRRGLDADGFSEGYQARAAIMEAAKEIRNMRLRNGLTQKQLASLAGMSQPEISRLEAGIGNQGPSVETLSRLARACDKRFVMKMRDTPAPTNTEEIPSP